jgi:hypothetical protein
VDGVVFIGELLHARAGADGRLEDFVAVRARSLEWQGETVVDARGVAEWLAMPETSREANVEHGGPMTQDPQTPVERGA